MKISRGATEHGIVVGNAFDKYGSANPVVRWIMRGFESRLDALVRIVRPATIHEVGCGEGYWVLRWRRDRIVARGSDFSETVIALARQNAREQGCPEGLFNVRSIYELKPEEDAADLIVCCEVLEHLANPREALRRLQSLECEHLIFSVPHEPLWRMLNFARCKYLRHGGNTPGHVQHWSREGFVSLVSEYFDVLRVQTPVPWTMLLCRRKRRE
jgi:SAM-dependent methyltransferase